MQKNMETPKIFIWPLAEDTNKYSRNSIDQQGTD